MSSTLAKPAFGTRLQMSDVGGTNFTDVAEIRDVKWKVNTKMEEVTAHDSGYPFTQVVATLNTFGPVTFMINYVPNNSTHNPTTGLHYVQQNRQERNWKIIDCDGLETIAFAGVIESIDQERVVSGVKQANVTVRGSGRPTYS